jgi:hypothetical protein
MDILMSLTEGGTDKFQQLLQYVLQRIQFNGQAQQNLAPSGLRILSHINPTITCVV